jgi:hypothetical protein
MKYYFDLILIFLYDIMSFFTKTFAPSVSSIFKKGIGAGRSLFTKAPQAFSALSRGLSTGSRLLGETARKADTVVNDPAVQGLASKVGLGGALGQLKMGSQALQTGSAALGGASKFVAPSTYSGQNPAQIATNIIEKASPVAKSLGMRFA